MSTDDTYQLSFKQASEPRRNDRHYHFRPVFSNVVNRRRLCDAVEKARPIFPLTRFFRSTRRIMREFLCEARGQKYNDVKTRRPRL